MGIGSVRGSEDASPASDPRDSACVGVLMTSLAWASVLQALSISLALCLRVWGSRSPGASCWLPDREQLQRAPLGSVLFCSIS